MTWLLVIAVITTTTSPRLLLVNNNNILAILALQEVVTPTLCLLKDKLPLPRVLKSSLVMLLLLVD
jgi:hypothetical protein